MKEISITNAQKRISADELLAVETQCGIIIPKPLKLFYQTSNGGRPRLRRFIKNGEDFSIHQFLSIKYGAKGTLFEDSFEDFRQNEDLPKGFLPFAIDEGGDYFLIGESKENFGAVFFFQSDYFDDPERAIVFLAKDFHSFLEGLTD